MKEKLLFTFLLLHFLYSSYACENVQKAIENFNNDLFLRFQIEGNFTNSGNKEVIGFFQWKSSLEIEGKPFRSVAKAICFIFDPTQNVILKTYELPYYSTLAFEEDLNIDAMPMEVLGKDVLWMSRSYGRVGDFNKNGKDELYLYSLRGSGFYPAFYEFDGERFKKILNYREISIFLDLIEIDTVNKVFFFKGTGGEKEEHISYIWDQNLNIYVQIEGIVLKK